MGRRMLGWGPWTMRLKSYGSYMDAMALAIVSPSIATAMVTKHGLGWWRFFYLMVGMLVAQLILITAAFWEDNGKVYRQASQTDNNEEIGITKQALKKRTPWTAAAFVLIYMSVEGWSISHQLFHV